MMFECLLCKLKHPQWKALCRDEALALAHLEHQHGIKNIGKQSSDSRKKIGTPKGASYVGTREMA
ncbi:MAG TPA: hypothetical protein VFF30_11315 [Nitrososphaerales archaeon]|nr:hypothetical protein [Nitrososphaerales archaeon]